MRERCEQALCMEAYKASLGCIVLNKRCLILIWALNQQQRKTSWLLLYYVEDIIFLTFLKATRKTAPTGGL